MLLLNVYATHKSPPPIDFPHVLKNRRDRSDPELVGHLHGFMGFVMGGGARPMNQTRFHVLDHLQRVKHQVAMEVAEDDMEAFTRWAVAANAIVFFTDGTVRSPDGAVLVDPETGDAEEDAHVPYPADALARKRRTEKLLVGRGIAIAPTLPPVISEVEVELRDIREIAQRCMALFVCAARAESIAAGQPMPVEAMKQKVPLGFGALSPDERAFMATEAPDRQAVLNHTWRYEALATLAWSIGAVDALPFPDATCDVAALTRTMFAVMEKFEPRPRTPAEILDALDLHYRIHWATTDARVSPGRTPMPAVDNSVVMERHHALNWLVRFEDADWDDVTTPT